MTYLLLLLGFVFLIKGAGFLVDGASSLAKKLNISNLVIGLTIVAFGTSAPELFVNLFASFNGTTDIAIGNIVGSNIVNVLLILGIAAIIYPLKVGKGTVWKEIPMSLLAAILVLIMANDFLVDGVNFNSLTRSDGVVLIAFFIIFLYYTFGIAKNTSNDETQSPPKVYSGLYSAGLITIGLVGLVIGGQWIVNSATTIAVSFGLSSAFIGLTIVAIGTSLPELATSAVAAYKKNSDIAVGNVVGSNIFNIFWILGLSSIIKPLPFKPELNFDLWVAVGASILLFIWMFLGKRHTLERWQGIVFILIYIGYVTAITFRG
ncbi:MAG: sodium:proton exchanger [Candidatus Magasanikbacteria bacterium RIFCSPHIGHO2_01_FULL_47_8]|uniref:Sodium:proton exchanger n=1 Tax=Candidatus Magasanikbacteria bacterium RIFCSPHIGHO2_01_FULL_47_8 TaxID=1798673 RepID=A0A1F6MCM2_9BACT|nr:MAG: sodium:proton exchanger [Candidatus Magasanikbacteria bacterium RIFCSPHIGHO2_01_FULL_47_8]